MITRLRVPIAFALLLGVPAVAVGQAPLPASANNAAPAVRQSAPPVIARASAFPAPIVPGGIVEQPCLPTWFRPRTETPIQSALIKPSPTPIVPAPTAPDAAYNYAAMIRADYGRLCYYRRDNAELPAMPDPGKPRIIFFGASVTEQWRFGDRQLFDRVIDRGISGQTTAQGLLRFRQDVIDLNPTIVQILMGTNDIAGNGGPTTFAAVENNIRTMAELARLHGIRVIIGSVTPARLFGWNTKLKPPPAQTIVAMNARLRAMAAREGYVYADYHAVLADSEMGMKPALTNDGVHPNRDGYAMMRPIADRAIAEALASPGRAAER
ncbi:GDSL-type esterase/lipase family protein [Flavisphingomonas formosensis]|uniref:GDSL-type esterase/lipase family protein n=1 Tax=Flavisphingomonas formosensis TaxID=861534 RepID=UPI0012FC5729|nr:GDSL-type esterase/lipase family protein [Sphingomonas formosensis]